MVPESFTFLNGFYGGFWWLNIKNLSSKLIFPKFPQKWSQNGFVYYAGQKIPSRLEYSTRIVTDSHFQDWCVTSGSIVIAWCMGQSHSDRHIRPMFSMYSEMITRFFFRTSRCYALKHKFQRSSKSNKSECFSNKKLKQSTNE